MGSMFLPAELELELCFLSCCRAADLWGHSESATAQAFLFTHLFLRLLWELHRKQVVDSRHFHKTEIMRLAVVWVQVK